MPASCSAETWEVRSRESCGEKAEAEAPLLGGPVEVWFTEFSLGNIVQNIDYSKPVRLAEQRVFISILQIRN